MRRSTPQEQNHVEVLKAAYQKWRETKAGSVDHWRGVMTDDAKFGSRASGAPAIEFTRTTTSKEKVKRYLAGFTADWEMIHYPIRKYIAQGTRGGIAQLFIQKQKDRKILSTPASISSATEKFCEFFEFYDTAQVISCAS